MSSETPREATPSDVIEMRASAASANKPATAAKLIPIEVHEVLDYAVGVINGCKSRHTKALPGLVVGLHFRDVAGLPIARLIPQDVPQYLRLRWRGHLRVMLALLLAPLPFAEPLVSAIQIAGGAADLLVSLFTDYRGYRGGRIAFEH